MDDESLQKSIGQWQPGNELPFAVGIMADEAEEGDTNREKKSRQRSGGSRNEPELSADLGLSKRWEGEGDIWPLPSEKSRFNNNNRYPGADSDWSANLDDLQGNMNKSKWADEYIWNLPAESSVQLDNKDDLSLLELEKQQLTGSSKQGSTRSTATGSLGVDSQGEAVGPGAYEVNQRAPGSLPSWFRRAPVRRARRTADESIVDYDDEDDDYSEYEELESRWTRCFKISAFVCATVAVGLAIGLGVALTANGDATSSGGPFGREGGNVTFQAPCNFTNMEQPDPFLQCSCEGEISIISEALQVRYEALLDVFIPFLGLADFNETMSSCTPRNVALMWLANDPVAAGDDFTVMQNRYALAVLYAAWDGDTWKVKDRWLSPEPECTWFGVSCMLNKMISELRLDQNLLKGPIPSEISLLDNLNIIDVSTNQLTGEIPDELYSLTTLEQLVLWDNILVGTISDKIANLRDITIFWVEKNGFSGPLPADSMKQLSKMMWFIVADNKFSGPVFDMMLSWPDLVAFHSDRNKFIDVFPSEIGNLSHLRSVDLSSNDISGSIPTEMGRATSLELFIMDGHGLEGAIPTELGNLVDLAHFGISLGHLEGQIPSEFGKLEYLQDIVLSTNKLSGSIPSQLGLCTQLRNLDLSQNGVEGAVPSELGALTNLQMLKLDWTQMTGIAPNEVCELRNEALESFLAPCKNFQCHPSTCCTPTCVR